MTKQSGLARQPAQPHPDSPAPAGEAWQPWLVSPAGLRARSGVPGGAPSPSPPAWGAPFTREEELLSFKLVVNGHTLAKARFTKHTPET